MGRLSRYVQSASRLYSIELAVFLLATYAALFGCSYAVLLRSAMSHSLSAILGAGFFALMSMAFLLVEGRVVRSIASR